MAKIELEFPFDMMQGGLDDETGFIPIINEDEEVGELTDLPDTLPILTLRNMVLFPGVVMPISVGRQKSLKLVKDAFADGKYIGVVAQKEVSKDNPGVNDIFSIGTIAQVIKILEMPDGSTSVILQGRSRFEIKEIVSEDPYFEASFTHLEEFNTLGKGKEAEALMTSVKETAIKVVSGASMNSEAVFAIRNIDGAKFLVNFICSNLSFKILDKQKLIELADLRDRAFALLEVLSQEAQLLDIKNDIQNKAKTDIDQQQREYFLHQQIKTIQDELGGNPMEQDIAEYKEKAKNKKWTKEVKEVFEKELSKLERMNPAAAEYSMQSNYISTFIDLPWGEYTKDNFDLKRATEVLDADHYGLEKVKERILEYLAVLKLKGDMKSPIICLVGPPGVGKTSLGKSVARSLDREYARMSLGGLHDEAEIRGHRKTYIGAMPGRIIHNINKAGSSNPVFILDEIDKLSSDFRGDPASALLEVLDPEQNSAFHDNYLEVDYDLSNVLFIATANSLAPISQPLLDRMEVIDISGYILEEKVEIAKRHLIPKQMENHGLKSKDVSLPKATIVNIIDQYTRESGVRDLDKKIAAVMRRTAKSVAMEEERNKSIAPEQLETLLGKPIFTKENYEGNDYAGVVTGLAWTSVGGDILYVESGVSKAKAGKLSITGNLGDVMKESVVLALEYIKSHADELGVSDFDFETNNIHVHVPEGAIPKDGPSAGITMVTSLVSSFTKRKVKKGIAMTGEITLRGKVLPVGGIKEKILAAKRAGIKEIILCERNEKDINEIKELYIKGLKFHYVKDIKDVLEVALLKQKVAN